MSFNENIDDYVQTLKGAIFDVMEEYGGRIEDELAGIISTAYPPSSSPGEAPHRRTGALRAGLGHVTAADGDLIITEIYSTRAPNKDRETSGVPGILNFVLDRPYMTDMYNQLLTRFQSETLEMIINRVNK